jgi:hypothetical protein
MATLNVWKWKSNAKFVSGLAGSAVLSLVFITAVTPASAQIATITSTQPTASGQPKMKQMKIIEWDLPAQMDAQPGAMMVDLHAGQGSIWFVTRVAGLPNPDPNAPPTPEPAPRVYRLDVKGGPKHNLADWSSWQLDPTFTGTAGGLRKIKATKDKRYVFVRTTVSLQRIDTQQCAYAADGTVQCSRTVWLDSANDFPFDGASDVAIDDYRKVFTALAMIGAPELSVIQRLDPNIKDPKQFNVKRWQVGGGAGQCVVASEASTCVAGIDLHPRYQHLVYYSEPVGGDGTGAIGELNTSTGAVRRWFFSTLSSKTNDTISEPRQLHVDADGKVWVNTGSGHLVSLDPNKNKMSKHLMPGGANDQSWGMAPDHGVVGYTASGVDIITGVQKHAVAMLLPDRDTVTVPYVPDSATAISLFFDPMPGSADRRSDVQRPDPKTVNGLISPTNDGVFVEAFINQQKSLSPSMLPLGITPDHGSSVGTFFYAVGQTSNLTINRVGRARLPRQGFKAREERDDEDHDDDGKRGHDDKDSDDDGMDDIYDSDDDDDGDPDTSDKDDDEDGIEDEWDSKGHKEKKSSHDDEQDTAAGSSSTKALTVSDGTLLVVGTAQSSDPLIPVTVEIVNATGQVVASSPTLPGASVVTYVPLLPGNYSVRVKNAGSRPTRFSTSIITRESWIF